MFSIMRACQSASSWFMSDSIVDIIKNTQVRLTEQILKTIRSAHLHMESLLFSSNGEHKSSITELDIDRSFTVVDMRIRELQDSSSMEVDEGVIKRGKKVKLRLRLSRPHVQRGEDHLQLTRLVSSSQTNLCGSQSSTSSSMSAVSESFSLNLIISWEAAKARVIIKMRQFAQIRCRGLTPQQGSVSKYATSLPHWLKSKEACYSDSSRYRHVVSLAVSVMCLMLKWCRLQRSRSRSRIGSGRLV